MKKNKLYFLLIPIILCTMACTTKDSPTEPIETPNDSSAIERSNFLGYWAGSYFCGALADTMLIMEGAGNLDVLVALHIQNSWVDTVYGALISADSIIIPEQEIGSLPGFAEIVLAGPNQLELYQHGLGMTCRGNYNFNFYPPVITSLQAEANVMGINSSVRITCQASDPDGDALAYSWTATRGTFTGSNSEVVYSSSDSSGSVAITCSIDDGTGGVDHATLHLSVTNSVLGSLTDIDGNEYQTVTIGNQTWMAENLSVTRYRNGVLIPTGFTETEWRSLETGAYSIYNDDNTNVDTYGLLYNWYAVGDTNNIAPEGWHVPSDEEWKVLESYIGMPQSEVDTTGWRGVAESDKLKEVGPAHWYSYYNETATNEYGFTALPAGQRHVTLAFDGDYSEMHVRAVFWTSTAIPEFWQISYRRSLYHVGIYRGGDNQKNGYSIRCIKD